MPFLDVQKRFGINVDRWWTIQSAEQPYKFPAKKACKIEYDDFIECLLRRKTMKRVDTIWRQREKLMKEGKYTPPPHHTGKGDPQP
uniref:NADH dehydrogenase [ubiquinone] iron-sulfur protein 5 n=1 Tax=Saimiri boliviensis boliviensis TaxID=39432 RepID=A0A2K6UDN9_SAIBB